MSTTLVRYEAARKALSECRSVDEVKDWVDKSAAMKAYAVMAKDKALEMDAAEIRLRAERRLGQIIAAQKETEGLNEGERKVGARPGANDGSSAVVVNDHRPTLAQTGISKDLSARAQKMAAVPEATFEGEVAQWRERVSQEGKRVTSRLEIAGAKATKQKPTPAKLDPRDKKIAQLEARIAELETENQAWKDEMEMARDGAAEAVEYFEAHQAALNNPDGKALLEARKEILRLERMRDDYMDQTGHMVRQIKALERKLARYENRVPA